MQHYLGDVCPPGGGTRSIHGGEGDPTYFFGLKIYTLSIFLGQVICHVLFYGLKKYSCIFLGLISERTFCLGFSLPSVDQKYIHSSFFLTTCVPEKPLILSLVFFWVGNFDARYFFGSKISGLCIFLGLQYEAPLDPPVKYTSSTPPGVCPHDYKTSIQLVLLTLSNVL